MKIEQGMESPRQGNAENDPRRAVAENLTTGETTSISERPQEENYSQAPTAAAEKAVDRIGAEVERQAAKGAGKKALDAAQLKTHTSRLQFSEAERATPELQKSIRKSEKAADRLDAARAAIPKQTKIKKERVFDEAKGKAKTRLSFEKTDKPPNGKLRITLIPSGTGVKQYRTWENLRGRERKRRCGKRAPGRTCGRESGRHGGAGSKAQHTQP